MHTYRLVDDFVDAEAEQALLASLTRIPTLYWDLLDLITPEIFLTQADAWQALALALETSQCPTVPADWSPAFDPHTTAHRLVDLHQRRLLAAAQERLAQALFDEPRPRRASSPRWKKRRSAARRRFANRPQVRRRGG